MPTPFVFKITLPFLDINDDDPELNDRNVTPVEPSTFTVPIVELIIMGPPVVACKFVPVDPVKVTFEFDERTFTSPFVDVNSTDPAIAFITAFPDVNAVIDADVVPINDDEPVDDVISVNPVDDNIDIPLTPLTYDVDIDDWNNAFPPDADNDNGPFIVFIITLPPFTVGDIDIPVLPLTRILDAELIIMLPLVDLIVVVGDCNITLPFWADIDDEPIEFNDKAPDVAEIDTEPIVDDDTVAPVLPTTSTEVDDITSLLPAFEYTDTPVVPLIVVNVDDDNNVFPFVDVDNNDPVVADIDTGPVVDDK